MITFKKLDTSYNEEALSLLTKNNLPSEDFDLSLFHVIGAFDNDRLHAIAALELYGPHALLRSVAVDGREHKKGIGTLLINEIIKESNQLNLSKLFILTETAEGFFRKQNFIVTDRQQVPASVQQSKEFQHICPASAVCMSFQLQ